MKLASTLFVTLAACSSSAAPSSTTPPTTEGGTAPITQAPTSPFTADGKHFAAERVYEGNCAPAGSRGGCYTLTLRPDGTMGYFMLDAGMDGTYEIKDEVVIITATGGRPQPFPLSSDHSKAGDLALKSDVSAK